MRRYRRNILVYAENNGNQNGFNIYLEFSGQREYLVTHRHNKAMYFMLKDGVRLDDIQRIISRQRSGNTAAMKLQSSMRYLMVVIDDYVTEREQCA